MTDEPLVPRTRCAPDEWLDTLTRLHDEGFTFFDFLSAVDQTDQDEDPGFDVVAHLYAYEADGVREVLASTRVPDGQPVRSLTAVWRGAAWHERETHEMFGIDFEEFDDRTGLGMRPLLLPDGFEGTPLRKSFMLAARASKPWPGAKDPSDSHVGAAKKAGRPARPRRKLLPPGVPPESWGPR
ncbi:NADH-quinone oxidoreductase subunit C [Leekyejoonella antrihumi]|uniref:NADH-quinone oxidoreductase subunit C n=1 Tax=Leekyejoonella antrihumi TaxID=1660198 RepID=A0A563E485_9MICO|nr:NADH-quinone oxidoreductase subunit C [Leekyejoonella antrihumi]TWP37326.1 NADH-quinone oxidoreductase subunit C [Leekyejoonella antrihumi]